MSTFFAPAKINLYLHVTGRLENGYHTLDSLIVFADVGDDIAIEQADAFSFHIAGPFAGAFPAEDRDGTLNSKNLVVRAVMALCEAEGRTPSVRVTLTKNLPLASGIGGGSADAAAVLRGLQTLWELGPDAAYLPELLLKLGADVPVCMQGRPMRIRGIGEILDEVSEFPALPVVLVNPMKACPTPHVFKHFNGQFHDQIVALPKRWGSQKDVIEFLMKQNNDLEEPAIRTVSDIRSVLESLRQSEGCRLARLSGSGATCFGLFENEAQAQAAEKVIASQHPDWWVHCGRLNKQAKV